MKVVVVTHQTHKSITTLRSVVIIVPMILTYTKMLQYMSKQQILVYVGGFFGAFFFFLAYYLGNINPTINPAKAEWDRFSGKRRIADFQ